MAKVQFISTNRKTAIGGAQFFISYWEKIGMSGLINKQLGKYSRIKTKFSYNDLLLSLSLLFLSGGEVLEDVQQLREEGFSLNNDFRISSPDTLARKMKALSVQSKKASSQHNTFKFNHNAKLNRLLLKTALQCGGISKSTSHTLDYDNTLIFTEKSDAKMTYKQSLGYCPGVATIGDQIVYIEQRDGNMPVTFRQKNTLERVLNELDNHGVRISNLRVDCGSYTKEILSYLFEKEHIKTYVRAQNNEYEIERIWRTAKWKKILMKGRKLECCSVPFQGLELQEKELKLIIYREQKKDHKKAGRLFDRDNYKVFTILTNDKEKSEKEVIEFYNKRGSSELNFRDLKGDYSWKKLPFSDINHNHTFLILTALVRNVITAFTRKASEKIRGLKSTSRLKRLRHKIITIPGEWVMKKGEWILRLFSSNKEIRKLAV
ncbi:IS1380 family transposase ISPto6 [Porphyromonas levii]|nr:IS1380 family transposase [Porphyromonas levii]MBR8764641.1 IS1380 family transposase ISPto6 [Porphyromonas levii]